MRGHMKLYLFGDQTFDIEPHLRGLLEAKDDLFLHAFLRNAYNSIRSEIYRLPLAVRKDVPRFTCLEDMVSRERGGSRSGRRCVPLDMAVTTLWQLGTFILQAETCCYNAESSRVVGLCTGAFAAAAVSCSHSTRDLIPIAVDAVVASFRTGLLVSDVGQRIRPSQSVDRNWSVLVEGVTSAALVQQFNDQSILPSISKPYISAYAPNSITVSGPPDVLSQLVSSDTFKPLATKSVPIFGPYHAPHIYSPQDATTTISNLFIDATGAKPETIPLLSTGNVVLEQRNFSTLLEEAIAEVLLRPIKWNTILDVIQSSLRDANPSEFKMVPFGSSAHHLVYNMLKKTELRSLVPAGQSNQQAATVRHAISSDPQKSKLAIIGMSGRFPDAKNNDAFWDILYHGLDVHKTAPPQHWDVRTHVDTSEKPRKNTSATPFGCWLQDPEEFDARFFNISPKEAPQIDPAQRLALMTAYEAIEQAGIVSDATPSTRPDRIGVFYGVTSNDWMETNSAQNIDMHMIPGGNRAFIPGRINYFFKFSGPSYAVDTACSSSLASIHLACNSIWHGDIDTAIAGGTNVITNPDFTAGLDHGRFLSRTGNCKTFDDGADGYCRGEGIATVIIKRLEDALADNDPIQGVILGAYTNHSAESESITRPHVGAQRAIFRKVLNEAAVDPYTISYIEMHGTGTQAGDAAEMSSVLDTFAPSPSKHRRARTSSESLHLGSAKANIGHGEAASGASSLIKVLMMMKMNLIVPHCGIKTRINHKFPTDFEERNVHIAVKPTVWKARSDAAPRRVLVNNFSAAGGNSALLLEDAPHKRDFLSAQIDTRKLYIIAVSAKTGISLQGNLRSLLKYLQEEPHTSLGELSYTTTARRSHHQHRVLFVGPTVQEICDKIKIAVRDDTGLNRPKGSPSVVFTFTGQGAQYPGMAQQLLRESSVFRAELHRLNQIAISLTFPSILPLIQSEEQDIRLFQPPVIQLASVCVQIALVKLWASWNIHPSAVVGHSLGEYAALNAAGVLSDVDTIFLVGTRAHLLQQKCTRDTHAMLVVDGSVDRIATALKAYEYETACINSPTETVLAGPSEKMQGLQEELSAAGMRSTSLKVPYAFHSSQVDTILPDYEASAAGATFSEPKIPIILPLDCTVKTPGATFDPAYLSCHSRQPVNMLGALTAAQDNGVITQRSILLEIGPHPAISKMIKATLGSSVVCMTSLQRGAQPWDVLARSLKSLYDMGASINWATYQRDFKRFHTVISLPAYAWDLKPYWIQYINDWSLRKGEPPVKEIQKSPQVESTTIHSVVEESGNSANIKIVVEADITRKDLSPLVQGHEVDGIPLCTPSVYADIALTLGTYLLKRYQPNRVDKLVDVSDMTVSKALILNEHASKQLIQVHAEVDWPSQSAAMRFMSFKSGNKLQEHSRCVVRFRDKSLQRKLQNHASETQEKMQALRDGIAAGKTARYNRAMVYRAIRPLARFHNDYRAIDEIVLNSETLEASSTLSFGSVKRDGNFHTHPAIIDSLTQACGFAMNCNDNTDLDVEVFMNHGWGSLQLFERMDFEKVYTTYTRMEPGPDKLWRGDAVIFEGDKVVAHFGQIAIQGVPRRVLKVILSLESGKKSQPTAPTLQPSVPSKERASSFQVSPASLQIKSQEKPMTPEPSILTGGLQIISEESGVAVSALTDETNFADMGIDSLLGLTISARFREQLDIDLDFNALLYEHPTIKDLKTFLTKSAPDVGNVDLVEDSDVVSNAAYTGPNGFKTPEIYENGDAPKIEFSRILQIISEESGVAVSALDNEANLADCGVDSLLSLIIASRFRNELDIDIDSGSLFLEHPTVGDLKELLLGKPKDLSMVNGASNNTVRVKGASDDTGEVNGANGADENMIAVNGTQNGLDNQLWATLGTRKQAVDELVEQYTADFLTPTVDGRAQMPKEKEKVVLVTGSTGSLGGHLTYHLALLEDVKIVVCLNREHREEAGTRQLKAMREKGIRFPDALKPKLLVLQADLSKPRLGLDWTQYDNLTASVTHIIHQAWPMSATRALSGFRSQFQVMRNLIDFARDVTSRRPKGFKVSFQMVSSIGVVGLFNKHKHVKKVVVPEMRASIDSVLPNGYSEAKWGCERMLDETLHRYPDNFRAMVARLGQIAGSKTSGYWNPMEHFGFLIKSSQTLNALPEVDGKLYWTPVNDVASVLSDLLLGSNSPYPIYHIDNPVGQPWSEMNGYLQAALKIPNLVPFDDWLERVRQAPQRNNPAVLLLEFLDSNYLRMSCGGLVLDVSKTLEHSETLNMVGPVSERILRKYIHIWKEIGFLQTTAENKNGFEKERMALWG
ncbi:ketoacyl-synt-domain-containing protein [Polychaeton citri CBS 116435]|uniref:Ketoacyl-synt-domain-containing protein n=1 Tax=Polychaeton citri CBS 116435 TaxID=1314669 RepID=A0A9P4QBL8_9PEZI|nr:ketoacyl-synt-domain-containing protein [Polychaeton citri CBS 116435]